MMELKPSSLTLVPVKVENWLVNFLAKELASRFTLKVEVEELVSLGDLVKFYDEERGQIEASSLLEYLYSRLPWNPLARVLIVADVDAYVPGLNFIFGLAREGWGGMVFLARLKPAFYGQPHHPLLLSMRLLKEAVHELGHSFGLGHCVNRTCVMRFSNTIYEVDAKTPNFCRRCALELERRFPGLLRAVP